MTLDVQLQCRFCESRGPDVRELTTVTGEHRVLCGDAFACAKREIQARNLRPKP